MLALQDTLGIKDGSVLRASAAMGGGIGGQRDACGGLIGAAMVFGMLYGRDRDSLEDREKMDKLIPMVGKLYKWYEQEFGSATCYDIKTAFGGGVYYDTHVPWQAELAVAAGVGGKCVDLVVKTVTYMVDALYDDVIKK